MTSSRDLAIFRRLLHHARPCWRHLGAIFVLQLIAAPIALLAPITLKIAADNAIGEQPLPWYFALLVPDSFSPVMGAMFVMTIFGLSIALLSHIHGVASWILQTYTGERLVLEFRAEAFAHAQRLSLGYHDERGTADTVYRIQEDAPAIQYIAIQGWIPLISAAIMLVAMLIVTWRIDSVLALVALAIAPVLFLLTRSSSRRARVKWHTVKDLDASAMGIVQEVLAALRVVKAFGSEDREHRRFVRQSDQRMWSQVKLASTQATFYLFIGLTMACGMAAALLIGVQHVRSGVLTMGQLWMVMTYMGMLYDPLRTLSTKFPEMQAWMTSVERVFALLDKAPRIASKPEALPMDRAQGHISFEHVSFAYHAEEPILRDVSFAIAAGKRVGIVGTTGSGKTTLMTLLSRFYDPDHGRILLDGTDLRDYKIEDLRRQYAIVLQDAVLFAGSIAENIAYARPAATRDEVIAAAKAANAHDFITGLPDGYNTKVGERGMRLSGGQRQRISIARAFLKDSPVLIMDEPTSAVDLRTEAGIMESMEALMHGRTTFMIAHRLGTLEHCDLLLVMERGRARVEPRVRDFLQVAARDMQLMASPPRAGAAA